MSFVRPVTSSQLYVSKLKHGGDLLDEITAICREKKIRLGRVEAIGAVQKARLAFYNQETREYQFFALDQPLEITCLTGNISVKDGESMAHVHVTLSDQEGNAYGGHLAQGTEIFACECIIEAFDGPEFSRGFDEETGLPLWAD